MDYAEIRIRELQLLGGICSQLRIIVAQNNYANGTMTKNQYRAELRDVQKNNDAFQELINSLLPSDSI